MLILAAIVWSIGGIATNHYWPPGHVGPVQLFVLVIWWAMIAGVIVFSLIRREHSLADYGFSFGRGTVWSLVAIGAVHVYLAASGKFDLSSNAGFGWSAMGALIEEIAFRVILINGFIKLLDGTRAKAFWAILASSALFSLPHIPIKSPAGLLGVFTAAVVLGYVYYKSRSVLLPAWIHSTANAGLLGGMVIGLLCLAVGSLPLGKLSVDTSVDAAR